MRLFHAGLTALLTLGLWSTLSPTSAQTGPVPVTGTVQRVIIEAPGFGQAHPGHDHGMDAAPADHSDERVSLVTDDGRVIDLPSSLAEGLETGDRAAAMISSAGTARSVDRLVSARASAAARPQLEVQRLPYALVSVTTPDTTGVPATIEEVRRWLLDATQSFFEREAVGSFDFSVHSTHSITLDYSLCDKEVKAEAEIRDRLTIPKGVGLILIGHNEACTYGGMATIGRGQPGQWVVMNYESPTTKPASRDFYETQGRKIVIHEIGHNLGLGHSGRWRCDEGATPADVGARGCALVVYGSESSIMGSGIEGAALDAYERWQLGVYGPGRLLSVEGGSGSAILLDDRLPLTGPDAGESVTHDGQQVVRALHLRDEVGEVWLTARDPLTTGWYNITVPAGVVAHLRVDRSDGHSPPVQADIMDDPKGTVLQAADFLLGAHDTITPGRDFTTPGGTRISVGAAVSTPQGRGFLVTWQGAERAPRKPGPPAVDWETGRIPWLAAGAHDVALSGVDAGDFTACSVVDDADRTIASWTSGELLPVPSGGWRNARRAWSAELGATYQATWRLPLLANLPESESPREVRLSAGASVWRTQCRDFQGRTSMSEETTRVRVDATPPRPVGQPLEVIGIATRKISPTGVFELQVRVPRFVDGESGVAGREELCPWIPAGKAGTCTVYVSQPVGSVVNAAVDAAGNRSALLRARYSIRSVKAVTRSSPDWYAWETGAAPQRSGASTTVTVRGKSAAIRTYCGVGTGAIQVRVNGGKPVAVNLAKSGDYVCTPIAVPLPAGQARLTITYTKATSRDALFAVNVLE